MNYVIKYSFEELQKMLIGNIVNFKSDCQLFPNFNVTGLVESMHYAKNAEIIFSVHVNKKTISIGSNMHNLAFKVMDASVH